MIFDFARTDPRPEGNTLLRIPRSRGRIAQASRAKKCAMTCPASLQASEPLAARRTSGRSLIRNRLNTSAHASFGMLSNPDLHT